MSMHGSFDLSAESRFTTILRYSVSAPVTDAGIVEVKVHGLFLAVDTAVYPHHDYSQPGWPLVQPVRCHSNCPLHYLRRKLIFNHCNKW